MSAVKEPLAPKMRAFAAANSGNDHLVELADKMDAARDAPEGEWSAKKMIGTWARARRAWCEVTGEDLV